MKLKQKICKDCKHYFEKICALLLVTINPILLEGCACFGENKGNCKYFQQKKPWFKFW